MKEIKNKTIYTPDNVKKFLEVYYFEKVKVPRLIINILIILVIIYFFTKDNKVFLDYTTFIFCLFGIIELNTTMLPKLNYRKLAKSKDSVLNTKIEYLFKKNNFKLSSNKDEYIDYNSLYKVLETKEAYYLYINKSRALIVDKKDMSDSDITNLTSTLKEQVSKYEEK